LASSPEAGAVCGNAARTDLGGGRWATSVPTATLGLFLSDGKAHAGLSKGVNPGGVTMTELIPIERIERSILLIRGQKVMLDRDLAQLYGVETRILNQAVRRNTERFPKDFMFRLTREEIMRISQFVISSAHSGVKTLKFSKNVMVFTEHGVAMLSSVLNSPRAVQVNIQIMRTFAKFREIISQHKDLARRLDELEKKYDTLYAQPIYELKKR
jgi:hypothetical protein